MSFQRRSEAVGTPSRVPGGVWKRVPFHRTRNGESPTTRIERLLKKLLELWRLAHGDNFGRDRRRYRLQRLTVTVPTSELHLGPPYKGQILNGGGAGHDPVA